MTLIDPALSEMPALLQSSVADFLKQESTAADRSPVAGEGYDTDSWVRAAKLGLAGLLVPEEQGGVGRGWLEAAIVANEIGKNAWPSPYLSTLLGSAVINRFGNAYHKAQWLPGICEGKTTVSLAVLEEVSGWDSARIHMRAVRSAGGWALTGTKTFVLDTSTSSLLIVICHAGQDSDALTAFCVPAASPGVHVTRLPTLDRTRVQSRCDFDTVVIEDSDRLGDGGAGWDLIQWLIPPAAICVAAESVGSATRAFELAVEYSKTRQQFDRPIGFYQGVSHKLADSYRLLQNASALVYRAASALDASEPDAERLASMAKVHASKTGRTAVGSAMQIHGGVGYTWERDLHTYWRRVIANTFILGSAEFHLGLLADGGAFLSGD
jgi:alkylation response protein AidB-like acyl-CoA dehydrogenase